ncbi:leucine-rich repeat protein [Neotamlana laminarinivorans]|uniref:Leucine-rich repeat domain-containing protein n=1 Tax=Neotamlana laminarinivorans TaxID=2883124 RepID=A0A9X1HYJ8_9FLAO|nr:leucine-rich repeat protein [Tamlana laminarinivorans]MCB4798265.1 leucine-rich repeat domain-containing protein [Tamlana laminarinivorans]
MFRKLLLLLLVLIIQRVNSQTFNDGVLFYTVINTENKYVSVEKLSDCPVGNLTIPETATYLDVNYTVTSISEDAFSSCDRLLNVTLPETITVINNNAFYNCPRLESINIPESVNEIGDEVFYYCQALTNITIPEGVTTIGKYTFFYCTNLDTINLPSTINTIKTNAFSYCEGLVNINLPDALTTIENYAFFKCESLRSLTIPENINRIEYYTFSFCSSLVSIELPNNLTFIGTAAFNFCSSLENLTIPVSVNTIQDYAFGSCTGLKNVTVNWSTPLVINDVYGNSNMFNGVNLPDVNLYVIPDYITDYEMADVWQDFNIQGQTLSNTEIIKLDQNVTLYPNPVSNNVLYIKLSNNLQLNQLKLFNLQGQIIKSTEKAILNTNNLKSGMYLVEVSTNSGKLLKKIMVL